METIHISITQEDIDASIAQRAMRDKTFSGDIGESFLDLYDPVRHCPVSRAATRALGKPAESAAGSIYAYEDGYAFTIFIPIQGRDPLTDWQNAFDNEKAVTPIEFDMIPERSPRNDSH